MFHRSKSEPEEMVFLTAGTKTSDVFFDESPTYVEPQQPVVVDYKSKSSRRLTDLLNSRGEVFGLLFQTLNADGSLNFVSVEAMIALKNGDGTSTWTSYSTASISLDVQGGHTRFEERDVTEPSPSPQPP